MSDTEQKTITCLLCCEETSIIGLGECNHKDFCYTCIYKLRELKHTLICPICNHENSAIIVSDDVEANFEDYDLDDMKCWDETWNLYVASREAENAINSLRLIKCFVPNCKENVSF